MVNHPQPRELIDNAAMSIRQILIILVCVFAMALDGYDVMSIALAAPDMIADWQLTKAQTGFILPLEFLGVEDGLPLCTS